MTVLTGFIPSPEGWAALTAAVAAAQRDGERLVVVNTGRGDAYADPRYAQDRHLEELRQHLTRSGVTFTIEQHLRGRDAADEVLEAAGTHGAGLIVIGIRHRSPVGKLIMGSTAQRILLEAPCPVLAVKAPTPPSP